MSRLRLILLVLFAVILSCECNSRKIGFKVKGKGVEKSEKISVKKATPINIEAKDIEPADTIGEMVEGSFMVASFCENCNNGYRLDQVVFTGFDKTLKNSKESFFIINNTDRVLTGVTLYIDYRTPDGRQLTKRFLKLSCSIPPGETRKADIPTFDTQRSFYYIDSERPKRGGNPFNVKFDPVAFYLQF